MSMYINRKKVIPFTLMEFEDAEEVKDSDPVLDALQVEKEE